MLRTIRNFALPLVSLAPAPLGAGERLVWSPCKGAFRAGSVAIGSPSDWDDANVGYFSWAGGSRTIASGAHSFAFGDQVKVTSPYGAGIGLKLNVSGAAGFSAGAFNTCAGEGCVALGTNNNASGRNSLALGSRTTATGEYTTAMGYRASNNGHKGTYVWGDASTTDSVLNQANNEFRIRAAGGIRLRTSSASNAAAGVSGNTGCDLAAGSGSWSCASSRYVKENFAEVDGEAVLAKITAMPVTTWNYIAEGKEVRHMGPMAQDFYSAFALGTDSASIGLMDVNGVTLAAIKALEERTTELRATQAALPAKSERLEQIQARLAHVEKRLAGKSK